MSKKSGQRVDYTHIRYAPVVNCVVEHDSEILLLKRSKEVRFYPGLWNGVSGFLDDHKSVKEKAQEEVRQELGVTIETDHVDTDHVFSVEAPEYEKTWILHPAHVLLRERALKLDREADECLWVPPRDALSYELVPGFDRVIRIFFNI